MKQKCFDSLSRRKDRQEGGKKRGIMFSSVLLHNMSCAFKPGRNNSEREKESDRQGIKKMT